MSRTHPTHTAYDAYGNTKTAALRATVLSDSCRAMHVASAAMTDLSHELEGNQYVYCTRAIAQWRQADWR